MSAPETDRQHADQKQSKDTSYQPTPANSGDAVQPSGPKGDNPATAGPGPTEVRSNTPENSAGHINPSAPEDSNTTPNTNSEK